VTARNLLLCGSYLQWCRRNPMQPLCQVASRRLTSVSLQGPLRTSIHVHRLQLRTLPPPASTPACIPVSSVTLTVMAMSRTGMHCIENSPVWCSHWEFPQRETHQTACNSGITAARPSETRRHKGRIRQDACRRHYSPLF
jgi:hypothetical protein